MSYGLQIWNASGGQILDVDDLLIRYVGSFTYNMFAAAGITYMYNNSESGKEYYVNFPGIRNDGSWYLIFKGIGSGFNSAALEASAAYTITIYDNKIGFIWKSMVYGNEVLYFDVLRV